MSQEPTITTVYEPGDDPADVALIGHINRVLHEHYPGYDWAVDIPPHQNIVKILNLTLDPRGKVGMINYKNRLDPGLKTVVMAAGEFLERYNMRRGRHDPADVEGKVMDFERAEGDPRLKKRATELQ